ncbi:MAG: alkaline phosphatase D family protein [Nitritalea sp.]
MKRFSQLALSIFGIALFSCQSGPKGAATAEAEAPENSPLRMAFGSCNKHDLPQPLWDPILADNPEVWIWMGDNVYGDTHDMELLEKKYQAQFAHPAYTQLRKQAQVIGIWDDHDYGINDGGKYYSQKEASQALMLDFLEEPADSPRRSQAGAYASYTYGQGQQRAKVILLDARYHRDTIYRVDGAYRPNTSGTILGEAQWEWLEKELRESDAQVHLIASGVQFIAEEHGWEKWANFPKELERLEALLISSGAANPVFLSGDRHIAEISRKTLANGQDIYDITSSGLTHTWSSWRPEPNKHRIAGDHVAALHYGLLEIDWQAAEMHTWIKGEGGEVLLEQRIPLQF